MNVGISDRERHARYWSSIAAGALMLFGCAGAQKQDAVATAELVAELSAQAGRWDKAIMRKDRAAIEANMAEDLRQIDRAGNVETKSSCVGRVVSSDLRIDPVRRAANGRSSAFRSRQFPASRRSGDEP